MRRRTFLATVGLAGLAGCTSVLQSDDGSQPTATSTTRDRGDDRTTTTRDDDEADDDFQLGEAAIVDLETANRTYAVTPTAYRTPDDGEIRVRFARTATGDHPATLTATLTNENSFANTFRVEWTPPFGRVVSEIPHEFGAEYASGDLTYRAALVLAPTANHDLVESSPGVSLADDGTWRLAEDATVSLPERVRLDPGETVQGEYVVVGKPEGVDAGRPTGVYEFSGIDDAGLRLAAWKTRSPGPDEDSRFAGVTVPDVEGDGSTTWFHRADPDTTVYVEPSKERGRLPERVDFTVVNKSREGVGCGHWNLYKLVDGEWFHVTPYGHTADCRVLTPGGAKTWSLNAYHGEALSPLDHGSGASVGYLGGGRYAVVAGYGAPADQTAALVELVGDPVDVVPTEDVSASEDGGTVTVTSPRHEAGEHRSPATLTLEQVADADRRVVAEQVMRDRSRGLRNTLAFVRPAVDRVVLRTSERVADRAAGYGEGRTRFRFRGQAYEATADASAD